MSNFNNVFGLPFSNISLDELGIGVLTGSYSGRIIVTPNVDHIVCFYKDISFQNIYLKSDVFVNDSRILQKLSSFGLDKIESLVPGSDLTAWLFNNAPAGTRITVIGSSVETASIIKEKYPLVNLQHYNPPMGFINDKREVEKCLSFCEVNDADIYFFAVGSPRQEILASKLKEIGSSGAFLCVGASLLFLSGEEVRAPKWVQLIHMEWFFRLIQDPKRLYRRYLIEGPAIFLIYVRELIKQHGLK